MGAGGSTAASCSSLDLANHKQYYRYHQHHLHEQRMQKYRKQQSNGPSRASKTPKNLAKGPSNMMKQASQSNFDLTQNHLMHECKQNSRSEWFDDTNNGPTRPVLVLPNPIGNNNKPVSPVHVINGAKRSNAGVASRIHQLNQRQLIRANELRKFSDSLPSLLFDQQQQPYHRGELISPGPYALSPTTSYRSSVHQDNLLSNHKSAKQYQQQIILQNGRNVIKNNHPNLNLVSRCDDPSYKDWSPSSAANNGQPALKRAISLSSLHNSHNNNHPTQSQQQHLVHMNYGSPQCNNGQLVSNYNKAIQSHAKKKEFVINNTTSDLQSLQKQSCNKHPTSYMKQQQQTQYNQPTPLAKKILKFKQVAANSGLSSKRYKKKQKQIQQQQQGCPVLPPLPRSQSLHELIQLRATENGQRMRTTGTLRGPLGSGETGNKVNLVVELLENRRQQKTNQQQQQQQEQKHEPKLSRDSTETMLSQASSSDDGIHDVSLSGGDQSTGDSRHQFTASNVDHNNTHRLSITSQRVALGRHRFFNKNHQSSDRSRPKFSNSSTNQPHGRPQSQRIDPVQGSTEQKPTISQYQPHKSTLKRSVSHSALQSNLHDLELNNDDEDESDDLNELAKFLYQFKQRQQLNKNQLVTTDAPEKRDMANVVNSQSSSSPQQQQQSPNSTTSSSGFASSTCTSNSISSTASDEPGQRIEKRIEIKPNLESEQKKLQSRKKYPAPRRPDDNKYQPPSQSNTKTKIVSANELASSNSINKNLISGQLKLSSSLLSIVDEYNSTLRANDRTSPAIVSLNNNSNLASVLLGDSNKMQIDENPSLETNTLNTSDSQRSCNKNVNDNLSTKAGSNCHQQHQYQLEQLRRYTQMRQMSQSELALNHLTSSTGHPRTKIPQVKGKRDSVLDQRNNNNINKPYKSKLINIIRRISDKPSEVTDCCGGSGRHSRLSASVSASPDPVTVGGNQMYSNAAHQPRSEFVGSAINQNEMIAPYSNQCSKRKYNPGKHQQKTSKGKSCLSESLCDLNFDCDFELIKNCGNEHRVVATAAAATRPQQLPGSSSGSLLASANSSLLDAGVERRCHKEMARKHQAINSSKGENNWRLVPNPLSMGKQPAFLSSNKPEFHHHHHQQQLPIPSRQSLDGVAMDENGMDSKGKLHANSHATDKLANQQQQAKLKWSASGWLMNSIGAGGSSGDRTKANELHQHNQTSSKESEISAGKICLKSISNSRTPLSTPSTSNNDLGNTLSCEQETKAALIESKKSFAKVNSEAKQLLNELDHSLDMVSGRYPFSRKVALSWWKTAAATGASDDYSKGCTNHGQIIMSGEEKFSHHSNRPFAISSSASDTDSFDFDDDDDNDDYARINKAMINATFGDVDVNQATAKLNDNLNSLSIEPGSPSDSFTFSAASSPVLPSLNNTASATAAAVVAKLHLQLSSSNQVEPSKKELGENHVSKQSICQQTNGCLLASGIKQQELIHSQIRNLNRGSYDSNHVSSSTTSSHETASHGISNGSCCNNGCRDGSSKIKLADNSNVCIGANKRIVSHDGERLMGGNGIRAGGKVKQLEEKINGGNSWTGLAPIAANDRFSGNKDSGNIRSIDSSNKVGLQACGGCINQDLCTLKDGVVDAKKQTYLRMNGSNTSNTTSNNHHDNNDKHDSLYELNKMERRLVGTSVGGCPDGSCVVSSPKTPSTEAKNNGSDDISRLNSTNIKSNRLLSKCQFDGDGKNFSLHDDSVQNGCCHSYFCRIPPEPDYGVVGGKNSDNCVTNCRTKPKGGIKSNGSVPSNEPSNLDADKKPHNADHLPIQGQQSCGLGQSCRSCNCSNLMTGATICASIARDNECIDKMNGQKQVAVKCDRQSSSKEPSFNGNNGCQIGQLGMRSNNFGNSLVSNGNRDSGKKTGCKSCSNAHGGGQANGIENIFPGKSRGDLHAGNGVTYSKTTAPKSEELKNKLITQQKPLVTCHCSSVDGAQVTESSFSSAVTHTSTNDHEIGKTANRNVAYQASASPKHPLVAANSNSFSKPSSAVEIAASTKSGFYYYEMDRNYSRQSDNDKQMTTDKIAAVHSEQQQQNLRDRTCAAFASVSNRTQYLDNCCQVDDKKEGSKCKVASCHHPSSSGRLSCNDYGCGCETSYNEDVKSQVCVIKDNLILGAGHSKRSGFEPKSGADAEHPSSSSDRGFVVEKAATETFGEEASTNCSHRLCNDNSSLCCRNHTFQKERNQLNYPITSQTTQIAMDPKQQQQEIGGKSGKRFNGVGKFSSPNRTSTSAATANISTTKNGDFYSSSKSSQNGHPLCPASLAGAPRLICKSRISSKPICRSNSELIPAPDKSLIKGRISIGQSSGNRQQDEPRLSLQNSLLNNSDSNTATSTTPELLSKSTKLDSSQLSLTNHCNGSYFVSPFITHLDEQHHNCGSTTALNHQLNDVDDNFILKRKTPNAGLKSLC